MARGGLSTDPDKRERQLAGLRKGHEALAAKIAAGSAFAKAPAAKAKATPPPAAKAKPAAAKAKAPAAKAKPAAPAVVDVDYDQEPKRARTPKRPAARKPAARRPRAPDRPRRGGFIDGFLGRLD